MIGQESIIINLKNNMPHSIILQGDYGSGRHCIVNEIVDYYNYSMQDITEQINYETLRNILLSPINTIYVVDIDKITIKQQNILLKTLEEPSSYSYFILLSTSSSIVLNTIINRCSIYKLEQYTKEQLEQFVKLDEYKNIVLNVCKTPGQIKFINESIIENTNKLCLSIIDNLNKANYANALTIANKINYKDDFNKFDIDIFLQLLCSNLVKTYKNTFEAKYLKMYYVVSDTSKSLSYNKLNKQYIIESMVSLLWQIAKEDI